MKINLKNEYLVLLLTMVFSLHLEAGANSSKQADSAVEQSGPCYFASLPREIRNLIGYHMLDAEVKKWQKKRVNLL